MKAPRSSLLAAAFAAVLTTVGVSGAENWTRFNSQPGTNSLIRIDGTSTVHDWEVESKVIAGAFEAGPEFPLDPANAKPGKVQAKANIVIPVRSLKSIKDGKPYSNQMDGIMYEKLLEAEHKQIKFELTDMTLAEAPSGGPLKFDTKGKLVVAGVTNEISMPVEMTVDGNRLKFSGNVPLKMSDYKIDPPAPAIAGGLIKTGDEVKLTMKWAAVKRP
jgi:polyisoprenoid-binding protein YceI